MTYTASSQEATTMKTVETIYADLKLADRMMPGRTPWQTLRKRAEAIAASDEGLNSLVDNAVAAAQSAPVADITHEAERDAAALMSGDWDDNGSVSIHLPFENAIRLLERLGYSYSHGGGQWISPTGKTFWTHDEALTHALVALSV
jgi:hypothetical protein